MSTLSSHGVAALPAIREAIKRAERTNPRTVALLEDVRWSILIPESIERRTPGVRAALARGASAERQAAAGRLGRAGRESIDALGELANDSDPLVVESAVRALSNLGGRDVLPALAALLKASDSNLRMTAAQALGRTKSAEATRHLLTALADPNEVVAGAALSALVEVNAKDSPFNPTPGAKEPLGPEAVTGLRQTLADPRWRVRAAAVEATGKLQVAELADDLKKLLADSDGFVVKNTLLALKGLRGGADEAELVAIARRLPALQGDAIAMLAVSVSSEAVNDFLGLFNQANASGQVAILAALGVRERYDDKPLNPDWKPVLRKAQTSPDVEVRRQLATLLRLAPPNLAGEIVGPLLGDDDPAVRDDAAVVAFGVISGRKRTAVGTTAHLAFNLDSGDDDTPLYPQSRRGAPTNAEPTVKPEQLQAWHAAAARIVPSDLTPVTAALLVATGDVGRDLPTFVKTLERATPASLQKLAEAAAIPVLATRLPWPEGRAALGHLEKHAALYLQALSQSSKLKSEAGDFLLEPARFLRAMNPAVGDLRHMVVERLLSGHSREQPGWSLLDPDPRSRRIVEALAQSTNAVWRALSVYIRGRPGPAYEDFAQAIQDSNAWVRAAAVQALANRRSDRAELERMAGPLLADDNAAAASIAAFALMEPSLRQAAGFAWQFGYFSFEDIQAGTGEAISSEAQADASPVVLTNQPAYLELARRQISRVPSNHAVPFALLLAQHGDFSALDKIMQGDSEGEARGGFHVPEALLAAINLSRNPRYLPRVRNWMEQINNEWEVLRLLKAVKGIPGREARQLRLDLNRRIRFPKAGSDQSEFLLSPDGL